MIDRRYLARLSWPGADARPVRRIAVIRALYLGDLLLAVPALRALRAGFPDAEITLIGLPWAASFARRFGRYLDRFVAFPGYPGIAEGPVVPGRTRRVLDEQRAYGYDLVVQMHGSGRTSNPFALALGARATVGYYPAAEPNASGLTLGAPYPDDRPEIFRNLGLTGLLGLPPRGLELEFPLCDADRAEAAALLDRLHGSGRMAPLLGAPASSRSPWAADERAVPMEGQRDQGSVLAVALGGRQDAGAPSQHASRQSALSGDTMWSPCIGLHAGARAPARRWPPARFAAVADYFATRVGARIVLTGGPDEVETARAVAERMEAPALTVAGKTSLGGLAALIAGLDLFISNDTGPAHLADALDVPSVTIVGPADHRRWAPLDAARHPIVRRPVGCNPCPYQECPIGHRCLRWIEAAEVIAVAERLLAKESVTCGA